MKDYPVVHLHIHPKQRNSASIAAPHSTVIVESSVMSTTHTPKWILNSLKPEVERHSVHIYRFDDICCIQCNVPDEGLQTRKQNMGEVYVSSDKKIHKLMQLPHERRID